MKRKRYPEYAGSNAMVARLRGHDIKNTPMPDLTNLIQPMKKAAQLISTVKFLRINRLPHWIIEYSNEIEKFVKPKQLINAVYQGALKSGLFEDDDIKTRSISFHSYQ